uniref:Movement protein 1 n=1 Tax=Cowpea mottle virus TaxID=12627 RepID=A0A8F8QQQ7_9TOMB|nr:movement protein 1 [Cowpea mottle virus]
MDQPTEARGRSRSRQRSGSSDSRKPKNNKQVQVASEAVQRRNDKPLRGHHGGDFVIVAHTVTLNINFNI